MNAFLVISPLSREVQLFALNPEFNMSQELEATVKWLQIIKNTLPIHFIFLIAKKEDLVDFTT